ncbi:MAG: FAD:protein FMN transferase [Rhodobacteraceae bacterium]|nr:FAD:protein FMN transferase [Paracoccaceae bacterium]
MIRALPRRRFLAISAAVCGLPGAAMATDAAPTTRWSGTALGAAASVRIDGLAPDRAAPVLTAVQAELLRLERIFSLYRPASALSQLNRNGTLRHPPPELLELLALSDRLHRDTGGAFDPTVQPVFALEAAAVMTARAPDPTARAAARQAVGWDGVHFDAAEVRLDRPGAGITLNGVAQGYITDRIAALLTARGLANILVDMGEVRALGRRGDGRGWQAGIATPRGNLVARVTLADRALATSAPAGTVLDPEGRVGHIFDPVSAKPADMDRLVSVSADSAALADGLSTAFCLMTREGVSRALARHPDATLEAFT